MRELVDLFEQAGRGDRRAFTEVVERTSAPLYRVALRILGNGADADEALQESFLRAHDALGRGLFHQNGSQPYGWLLAIVTRACVDTLRRRKVRPVPVPELDETLTTNGENHTEHGSRLRDLYELLDDLVPDQRAALVLRYVEGLSNAEVARALSISEGAVEQRLIRARAALKRKLNGDDEP